MAFTSVRSALAAVLAAGLVSAGGCATTGEKQASQGNPDAQFLTSAAHDSTAELDVSKMAADKAADPRVKQFAQHMVQDHTTQNQQMMQLAQQKGLDLPTRPDEEHAKAAASLSKMSGPEFDRAYMSDMVADHAKLVSKFEDKSREAMDPDVRVRGGGGAGVAAPPGNGPQPQPGTGRRPRAEESAPARPGLRVRFPDGCPTFYYAAVSEQSGFTTGDAAGTRSWQTQAIR